MPETENKKTILVVETGIIRTALMMAFMPPEYRFRVVGADDGPSAQEVFDEKGQKVAAIVAGFYRPEEKGQPAFILHAIAVDPDVRIAVLTDPRQWEAAKKAMIEGTIEADKGLIRTRLEAVKVLPTNTRPEAVRAAVILMLEGATRDGDHAPPEAPPAPGVS